MKKNTWRTKNSKIVYQNDWFTVREDHVIRPNGSQGVYNVLEKGNFVAVIVRQGKLFTLVEQYRYPISKRSWELVEGGIEAGEDPEAAARRELKEEAGITAATLTKLGFIYTANGHSTQGFTIFLADIDSVGAHNREGGEADMVVGTFSYDRIKAMIKEGVITDGPTVASLYFYEAFIQKAP